MSEQSAEAEAGREKQEIGHLAMAAGARLDALVEATETLRGVRDGLEHVAEAVEHQPTKADLDRAIQAVADSTERKQRWVRHLMILNAAMLAFVLVVLVGLAYVAVTNRDSNRYIRECTTPSEPDDRHECFEDGQKRTAKAIQDIIEGIRQASQPTPAP